MANCDIGIYGLAVMGQNLVLNIADHGYRVAVHNRTQSKTRDFMETHAEGSPIEAAHELQAFVECINKPRVILLIVKAGEAIDAVIEQLTPYLEADDIIIDGGNSHYKDTDRRVQSLAEHHIQYMGMGISGGEEGARYGPSLMPGGPYPAYERVDPILRAIAADADGEPCVAYLGPGSAGHYVKMVHNGIEYAIMQAIAEIYDLLRRAGGMNPTQISEVFRQWNDGHLSSFLVEITADILAVNDPETDEPLVDVILDRAKQKGTGKWTTQDALDLGVPVPTISAAVEARVISAFKQERQHAAPILRGPAPSAESDQQQRVQMLERALLATEICAYAQGFATLRLASEAYGYDLNLSDIAKIWRNGCIIRAEMLNDMRSAFADNPDNLMISAHFAHLLADCQHSWRDAVGLATQSGIPVPAMSSALAYYDSYRSGRLPASLIQAQRDYFGAHTYERRDKKGTFHTEWQHG